MDSANNHTAENRKNKAQEEAKMEQEFLKGTIDQTLGVYCDLFSAKSTIKGQNGGIITAILMKGLSEGIFDAAIVVRPKNGYDAEAGVAENVNEVLESKGTRYLKINVSEKLRELVEKGKKKIAIVCTPCEVKVARKIQQNLPLDCKVTIIGLFCFEAFSYAKLRKEVTKKLGVDIDKAERTQIQHGKFTVHINGNEYSCRVKELTNAAEKICQYCDDFTARLADISVGSAGSKEGYSTVIVRSQSGEKIIQNLNLPKETVDKEEIIKLCNFKRARAEKNIAELEKNN